MISLSSFDLTFTSLDVLKLKINMAEIIYIYYLN